MYKTTYIHGQWKTNNASLAQSRNRIIQTGKFPTMPPSLKKWHVPCATIIRLRTRELTGKQRTETLNYTLNFYIYTASILLLCVQIIFLGFPQ